MTKPDNLKSPKRQKDVKRHLDRRDDRLLNNLCRQTEIDRESVAC